MHLPFAAQVERALRRRHAEQRQDPQSLAYWCNWLGDLASDLENQANALERQRLTVHMRDL
jgi:hypothetical protein